MVLDLRSVKIEVIVIGHPTSQWWVDDGKISNVEPRWVIPAEITDGRELWSQCQKKAHTDAVYVDEEFRMEGTSLLETRHNCELELMGKKPSAFRRKPRKQFSQEVFLHGPRCKQRTNCTESKTVCSFNRLQALLCGFQRLCGRARGTDINSQRGRPVVFSNRTSNRSLLKS